MAQPAPTIISPVAGFMPTGTTRYWWIPTIAVYTAPTLAECSAGTDLTQVISAIAGFTGTSNTLDFPNAGSRWTPKIPGMITADDSSFTINRDKTGADTAIALFNDGSDGTTTPTSGFFAILPRGNVASAKMKIFPIQVTSLQDSTDLQTGWTCQVNVAIVNPPSNYLTIPTA